MTEQRIRDLRALAADPAATPGEARAARAAAERIAERLQGRQHRQRRALRSVEVEAVRYDVDGRGVLDGADLADVLGDWESRVTVDARARVDAARRRVDVSTSRAGAAPTVEVHREYGQRTTQAAPYWCGACGQGRNYPGPCPKCHGRVTEV